MDDARTACLVYISPAGTTRKVGRNIAALLEERGYRTSELDLDKASGAETARFAGEELSRASLLVVGSPTYADHVVYPVASFLDDIPAAHGRPALVYTTFGEVNAGVTLVQMTGALHRKGYRVKGAAQVLCLHSIFFRSRRPLAQSHPDDGDWRLVEEWMEAVASRLDAGDAYRIDPRAMRPSNPFVRLLISTVINMRVFGAFMPRYRFCSARCRRCGACQERCPTGRLDVLPPGKGRKDCLFCMECIRVCPGGAFDAPMWAIQGFVLFMRRMITRREDRRTRYYL